MNFYKHRMLLDQRNDTLENAALFYEYLGHIVRGERI